MTSTIDNMMEEIIMSIPNSGPSHYCRDDNNDAEATYKITMRPGLVNSVSYGKAQRYNNSRAKFSLSHNAVRGSVERWIGCLSDPSCNCTNYSMNEG
jgi:hypothetical protein